MKNYSKLEVKNISITHDLPQKQQAEKKMYVCTFILSTKKRNIVTII